MDALLGVKLPSAELAAYKVAASRKGLPMAVWVRNELRKAAGLEAA